MSSTLGELLTSFDLVKQNILTLKSQPCTCVRRCIIYQGLTNLDMSLTLEQIETALGLSCSVCQRCSDLILAKVDFKTLQTQINECIQTDYSTTQNFLSPQ